VILLILVLNFEYQLEEDPGSAEEQPVSNKVDVKRWKGVDLFSSFIFIG